MIKKSKLFTKYFICFIVVIIVPVLLSNTFMFFYSNEQIADSVYTKNYVGLNSTARLIEENLNSLRQSFTQISVNPSLNRFMYKTGVQVEDYDDVNNIKDMLRNIRTSCTMLYGAGIYLDNMNSVIADDGLCSIEAFFDKTYQYQEMGSDDWKKIFKQTNFFNIIGPTNTAIGEEGVKSLKRFITITSAMPSKGPKKCTILFMVDEKYIHDLITDNMEVLNADIMILDQKMQSVSTTITPGNRISQLEVIDAIKTNLTGSDGEGSLVSKINGMDYYISYVNSQRYGLKYIAVIPHKYILEKSEYIKYVSAILSFFFVLVGVVISFLLSKIIYKPIGSIIQYLNNSEQKNTGQSMPQNSAKETKGSFNEDEFKTIYRKIKDISTCNEELNSKLQQSESFSKEMLIVKLLRGEIDSGLITYIKKNIFPNSNVEGYRVVLVKTEYFKRTYGLYSIEEVKLIRKGITAMINQKFCQYFEVYSIELENDTICFIVSIKQTDIGEKLESIRRELQEVMQEDIDFIRVSIMVGDKVEDIGNLPVSYSQCNKLKEYIPVNKGIFLMLNGHAEEKPQILYHKFSNKIKRVYTAILAGEYENAALYFNEILDTCLRYNNFQRDITGFVQEILKSSVNFLQEQGHDMDSIVKSGILDDILECKNLEEINHAFADFLGQLSECMDTVVIDEYKEIIDEIVQYMDSHYYDELSLEMVGGKFGLSVSYLSKLFKKHTNVNFVDYLNCRRIDEAKRILAESSLKITEVGEKVGYLNTNTFMKTFKKYVGVSPKVYRNIISNSTEEE